MAIQMTREEYKRMYGVDPVVASSTLDTKPAPIRMTRAEYESLYGEKAPQEKTLGSRLADRVSSTFSQAFEKPAYPGQAVVHGMGQVAGAIGDVAGEALSPVISKLYDKESGKVPNLSPEFVEGRDKAVETATTAFKGFEEKNPNAGQFVRDVTNIGTLLPFGKPASTATQKIAPVLDERVIAKRAEDLAKLEGKYAKTRKANQFADDAGEASRRRIAETDVLVNAVDENGLLRTKNPGGPIDQYKAQTIDGVEDIVRKNLEQSKDVVDLPTVKTFMTREIMNSGLDGADLVRAIKGIDDEIAGLLVRTKGNNIIDLTYLQDAKIGTTRNINYMTPPETSTYRKAIARAYKNLIEDKSSVKIEVDGKLFGVKDVNAKLAEFYKDIKRLENLDGTRVEGGKLGKYLAQGLGTAVGMGAGSVGGAAGSVVGGLAGGELAAFLKGKAMAGTFGRATGKTAPKSALLERAKLKIPDAKVMAPKNITKTKEITSLEDDIAKNVDAQKKAIAKGDFTLVATLKQIYVTLVEALKTEIAKIKEMAKGQGERGFANFFDDGQRVRNSNQSQATTPPTKAQNISTTVPPTPERSSASVGKADTSGGFEGKTYYHTTSKEAAESIRKEGFKAQVGDRTRGVSAGKGIFLYEDIAPTKEFSKNITWAGKTPEVVETTIQGKIFNSKSQSKSINALAEDLKLIERLKSEGYVGIRGTENEIPVTFVFDEKALKPSTPNPLYTEARKYKSAEEFVKKGWKITEDKGAVPGETPFAVFGSQKNPLATIIDVEGESGVILVRQDGSFLLNPKTKGAVGGGNGLFDTIQEAQNAFESELTDIWKKANGQ